MDSYPKPLNFQTHDMNPSYAANRGKRVEKCAGRYLKQIKTNLKNRVDEIEFKKFTEMYSKPENQTKMSYSMLRNLDSKHKKAFVKLALDNDQKVQEHVMKVLDDNREMQEKVMEAKWNIENERDDINEINREMDEQIRKKREAYEEEQFDRNNRIEFKLFQITDMYKLEKGWCYACDRNMSCKKHGLVRKEEAYDESQLDKPGLNKEKKGKLQPIISVEEARKIEIDEKREREVKEKQAEKKEKEMKGQHEAKRRKQLLSMQNELLSS